MKTAVRYYTKNGGTQRLAEAIAKAVNAEARTTSEPLEAPVDVLFLGASVYAGKPNPEVTRFIQRNGDKIGRIVVFSTSASGKSTHGSILATAADAGVKCSEVYYHCPGAFMFLHKGRPNDKDCAAAAAFALAQIQ